MSDAAIYLVLVCGLIAGIPMGMCVYFMCTEPIEHPWDSPNLGGNDPEEIWRGPMTCMDCGNLTGSQLWRRDEFGRTYYEETQTHECRHCGYRMTNISGQVAPEY